MAQSVKKVTTKISDIQSKAQEAVTSLQQKTASSTKATQSGSTETPVTTDTPKVTQTAKAVPSVTRPDVNSIVQNISTQKQTTPQATTTTPKEEIKSVNIKDLLGSKTQTTQLRKADTTNILDDKKEDTPIATDMLAKSYDNVPENIKETVGDLLKENGIKILKKIYNAEIQENKTARTINNLFATAGVDTPRGLISTVQGYLNKASTSLLPKGTFTEMTMNALFPGYGLYADKLDEAILNTEKGKQVKEERDKIFKSIFDETERRDKKLENIYGYKQAKSTADKWAEQGNTILDAMNTGNWDIVATRVGETIGQMLPIVGTALLTKNPGITAAATYTIIFGDSYKRSLVDINRNPEFDNLTAKEKDNLATIMAQIEAGIETIGDVLELAPFMKGKFSIADMTGIKNVILRGFLDIEGSAIIEGGEEVMTEILQNIAKRAYGGSDSATAQELGELFMDTWAIMQFVGLLGGVKGGINTYSRTKVKKALEKEAANYDNFNDFEANAKRAGIDKDLIQEAWANVKRLSTEQTNALEADVEYVEDLEKETSKLYEEKENIEKRLEELRTNPEENKELISKYEVRQQEIDNRIEEIDNSLKEYTEYYTDKVQPTQEEMPSIEETTQTSEELPANKPQQQLPKGEGGENLSEQTMTTLPESQASVKISQRMVKLSKNRLRNMFEKSVEYIDNGTKYKDTEFGEYIYASSGKDMILREKEKRDKMLNKVKSLLKTAGAKLRFVESSEKIDGAQGLYEPDIHRVSYIEGEKDVQVYGHEIFHAIRNLIRNNRVSNPDIQEKLDKIFNDAVEEVKKEFGMDGYTGKKGYYANLYAEEWLANAFGEYLANREIAGPKTFKEKIVDFFMRIIDFLTNAKVKKSISKELESAFETIARGEVGGTWGIPLFPQGMVFYDATTNPIESSTDITQEAMAEEKGEEYTNLVKEDELQSKQQEELGDHYENIVEAGKQSDKENSYEDLADEAPIIETTSDLQTTAQTVKDAFGKDKNKSTKAFSIMKSEATQAVKDIMTPALSRIYNISPRIAGRLVQMETQRDINIYRYRERAKPFVEAVSKLSKKDKLEVKKALLDYGALAYEQGENIEQYKQQEVAKLKEALNKYGITNEMIDNTIGVLNELGQKYKDAGLSITLTDMYFPRTVVDYEGLTKYISDKTGIAGKEKDNLLNRIAKIKRDEKLTDEEKEKRIRRLMTVDYKEPGTTSKHAKERKMGLLSEWGEGIYQFYADPMESLDNYIVNMENAIQRQLFLGGLQEEAGLKGENVSMTEIVEGLVDEGKISNEDLEELKKSVLAVLDKKPTPKVVSSLKNFTYIATLANFLSAINQLDDLAVVIIKDKAGLKNIVKSIFGKAGIKYTDLGLEDSYEMFRGKGNITNWFFKKSLFNAIDRLGKTSFINTAWDSLKSQAKNETARNNLIKRLIEMYGEETANHIIEKIDSGSYMTNGQIDIDILTDLLYQLGSTQPIYTSAMPTAYLNNGWVRLCYALQSFTIKRIDFLIEGTKQVYRNNGGGAKGSVAAGAWLMSVSVFLSLFGVVIGDLQDWIKGDEEETVLWKLGNEGINEALKEVWNEGKASWLKIWNLSLYDKNMYKRDGLWGVFMNKMKPPMIGIGNNFVEAITEHNEDEITDLVQYVPIIGKLLYYRYFDEIGKATNKSENGFVRRKEDSFVRRDESGFVRREEEGFVRRK